MNLRSVRQLVQTHAVSEGAGVTVHRSIGTPALRHLDPFLMLDHFGSDDPEQYIAGFPDHPHRGFNTFTYMLEGHMEHRDSMGNRGDLSAGGAQWMKAARGVIHSEMPQQTQGRMSGFQLWINLPAAEKMADPAYQEYGAERVPEVVEAAGRIRVLVGEYGGRQGCIQDPHTEVRYLDLSLVPGASFQAPVPAGHNAFLYVFEGEAEVAADAPPQRHQHPVPRHSLAVLGPGDSLALTTGPAGARCILVSGRPLGEPIVQYGPFVMNTREEIEQAFADYKAGRLARAEAA
jgi:redox-sensitive bicupin YhaK (pirin superfamily)